MNRFQIKLCAVGVVCAASLLAVVGAARAQIFNEDQELAARRQAILRQDEFITDDGRIIDQDDVRLPPPQTVVAFAKPRQVPVETVAWVGRYYGRPYAGNYYAPPRARYYARYPGYYAPYYGYGGYGYGNRGYYFGAPRYYNSPYGTARVGGLRFYWR
jgi:hypothetical protein